MSVCLCVCMYVPVCVCVCVRCGRFARVLTLSRPFYECCVFSALRVRPTRSTRFTRVSGFSRVCYAFRAYATRLSDLINLRIETATKDTS